MVMSLQVGRKFYGTDVELINSVAWLSGVKRFLEFSSVAVASNITAIFCVFTIKKPIALSGTQLHNEVWFKKKGIKSPEKMQHFQYVIKYFLI